MDIRIKKYIQYKLRTLEDRKQELVKLKSKREELRKEILDASPGVPDGQPRGKGGTGDPTQRKALKLIDIDRRIAVLDGELKRFLEIEQNIKLMRKRHIPSIRADNKERNEPRVCSYASWDVQSNTI